MLIKRLARALLLCSIVSFIFVGIANTGEKLEESIDLNEYVWRVDVKKAGLIPADDTRGTTGYFPAITFRIANKGDIKSIKVGQIKVIYKTNYRLSPYTVIFVDKINLNQTIKPGKTTQWITSKSKFGYDSYNRDTPSIYAFFAINGEEFKNNVTIN